MPRFLLRLPYGNKTVPAKNFSFEEDVVGQPRALPLGKRGVRDGVAHRRQLRQVPLVPEHHRPAGGWLGRGSAAPPVRGDGRDPDQDARPRCRSASAASSSSPRRASSRSRSARTRTTRASSRPTAARSRRPSGSRPRGKDAELNYRLGTQLPYMFVVCRIAHYIKVLQREQIGSWKERGDLENELNKWIGQYVADMDVGQPRGSRQAPAPQGADHRRGRSGQRRLVQGRHEGAPALQVHGRVLHAEPRRQARQGVTAPSSGERAPRADRREGLFCVHRPAAGDDGRTVKNDSLRVEDLQLTVNRFSLRGDHLQVGVKDDSLRVEKHRLPARGFLVRVEDLLVETVFDSLGAFSGQARAAVFSVRARDNRRGPRNHRLARRRRGRPSKRASTSRRRR